MSASHSSASLWAMLGCLLMSMVACNHLDQKSTPVPGLKERTSQIRLITQASGQASLAIDSLGISRRAPFTLDAEGFKFGKVVLVTDSTLAYQDTSKANWPADSGTLHVCQNGACIDLALRVKNSIYVPPMGKPTCQDLGLARTIQVVALNSTTLENLPGLSETGAKIDSVWGMLHQVDIKQDSVRLAYSSAGGEASGYYLGWDIFYYRIKRPSGQGCYTAWVQVFIPDTTSYPQARSDSFNSPSALFPIVHSQLYANDKSFTGNLPSNPSLKLNYKDFDTTPNRHLATRNGVIIDTTMGGQPSFYYKRTVATATRDTVTYYLREGPDDRITKAQIFLTLP